jgi:uncharacterized protein (DUF2062 family)
MRAFWRRRVAEPLMALLKQGLTPQGIALSLAVGFAVGLFPIIGVTSLLGLAFGALFRLNLPAIQLANWLIYPLQLVLILPFVRWGERLVGAVPVPLSVPQLVAEYNADALRFLARFGRTGLHGILGWATAVPFIVAGFYVVALPILRVTGARLRARNAAPAPAEPRPA